MFGCEVPLVPFWKLQLSILHNIIYRCIELLVRVQLCQTAIVVLVYAVHWHQANMKEKVIWYDHDEKWSWKWSEKDGHTGARTQDHSVISTALYRLSYTTSFSTQFPPWHASGYRQEEYGKRRQEQPIKSDTKYKLKHLSGRKIPPKSHK